LPEDGPRTSAAAAQRILNAFNVSRGQGVLHLGAAEPGTELHPTLSYWRDIGQALVARVCGSLDPTDPKLLVVPDVGLDEPEVYAQSAPPMQGAELITPALLAELWSDIGNAIAAEAARYTDGVQGYLKKQNSVWNVVGRVCLHLAENKRDPSFPFAFIATYVHKVSKQARPQHLPPGRALKDYAGARNRQKLLALLAPLSRAADQSAFIRELVDSGDIYHPLAWTPKEAHRFLCEIALYEQAGLVVRMPDWWSIRSRPRPKVSVSVGGKAPSNLGMDALLDFDVELTLDGESLSAKEIETLLAASEGLVLIKGKWVEVDRDKLSEVLDQWREVQRQAQAGGISFGEAMRMLAGAQFDGSNADGTGDARPEWSTVIAGKWLSSRLDALRSPAMRAEIEASAYLKTEFRPYQKIGVQWLVTLRGLELGGCLADDMGLGKTIQVLGVLSMSRRNKEEGTDLLVVPASLLDNWRLEIERFAPELKVLIAHPSRIPSPELKKLPEKNVDAQDAVITTYGTAMQTGWIKSYAWRNVILDEAQAIKNPDAKQTKAIKSLNSRWRLVLTGTPVEKALHRGAVEPGVIEKIAAMASRDHGDARRAVALLAKSAYLAEKAGTNITFQLVDQAAAELDQDRHLTLLRSAPPQLRAAMAAVIEALQRANAESIGTGEAYDAYKAFCQRAGLRPLTGRAFGDLTPSSSYSLSISCNPAVTHTALCRGPRPVVKALGAVTGERYRRGKGSSAFWHSLSTMFHNTGSSSAEISEARAVANAILSLKTKIKKLITAPMTSAGSKAPSPPSRQPIAKHNPINTPISIAVLVLLIDLNTTRFYLNSLTVFWAQGPFRT